MELTEFIAAIDIGTSKIVGIIGAKTEDDILKVSAIEEEPSDSCIKRGCIQNVEETAAKVKRIITKLENRSHCKIGKIYVGLGGQSLHSIDHKVNHQLNEETPITDQIIESLKERSRHMPVGINEIYDIIPNEYMVDGKKVNQPVGVYGEEISVTHKLIIGRPSIKKNIQRVLEKINMDLAGFILSPIASSCILTEAEKNLGVVLVDFGAGTTTVSVYKDGLLRHMAVLPIGGNCITYDISSLQIIENEAERLKAYFGDASPEITESETQYIQNKNTQGTESSKIQAKILHQIVLCRSEEIIENINNQIKLSGYEKQHLPSGVVITGGGAKLKNIQELISKKTEMESRIGTLQKSIQSQFSNNSGKELKYSVILGLLINGVVNCKKEEPVKIEVPVETPPVKEPVVEETKAPETRPERESNHNSSKLGTFGKIFKDLFTEPGNDPKLED